MLFGEVAGLAGFNVDHADYPVLDDQRDGQLGTHVGNRVDIALLFRDIIHQDRFPQFCCPASDALSHFHPRPLRHIRGVPHLEANSQFLGPFV